MGKVRTSDLDPTDSLLDCLQITQNKFARFLHGSTLMDRINTNVIFNDIKILSVNQMNAQIKLLEVWKSIYVNSYPLKWVTREDSIIKQGLKFTNKPDLVVNGHSKPQMQSFFNDAAVLWNLAPKQIKECKSIGTVKKCIKTFVKTLPI